MSQQEIRKSIIISKSLDGSISIKEAAQLLGLSERQIKRLRKLVKDNGPDSLVHGNRGKRPLHALSDEVKEQVIFLAQSPMYQGSNFTHLTELLEEREDICISVSSIHRILGSAGFKSPKARRKRRKLFRSRPRKAQMGLMILMDASVHAWLEERGPSLTLHAGIDDASGLVVGATFTINECAQGYFTILEQMLASLGVPWAIYTDQHAAFVSQQHQPLTIDEELAGIRPPATQLLRALRELSIEHIRSLSPQSRGRIERLWGTFQSRLIIELRLNNISSLTDANAFLPDFISKFNNQFAVAPQNAVSAFRASPSPLEIKHILCHKEDRSSSAGSTFSYNGIKYQLVKHDHSILALPARAKLLVHQYSDGSIRVLWNNEIYETIIFQKPPKQKAAPKTKPTPHIPSSNHPWRKSFSTKKDSPLPRSASS